MPCYPVLIIKSDNHIYDFPPRNDKDKVSEYFPVNTVLLGLFDLCTKLFGVNFEASICDVHIGFMHDQVGSRNY